MAEAALSATETALENQRIGGLQIRVAALCTLIQICDGYDVSSIGYAVPSLTHAWNRPGPAFTTAFLWSSIGIMVGAPLPGRSVTGWAANRCCSPASRFSVSPRCSARSLPRSPF
jgi:hypothetical protein